MVANVESSVPVQWERQEEKLWTGSARLPWYPPTWLGFLWFKGLSVRLQATWPRAFVRGTHDFVVSTGERPASRLSITLEWPTDLAIEAVRFDSAPFDVTVVRLSSGIIDTSKINWTTRDLLEPGQADGWFTVCAVVERPLPNMMYRLQWSQGSILVGGQRPQG